MTKSKGQGPATRVLGRYMRRNGVLRTPNMRRREGEGQRYKKGYEIRFVAFDEQELRQIQRMLLTLGIPFGRHFVKANRIVQPVYGREYVEGLCARFGIEMANKEDAASE